VVTPGHSVGGDLGAELHAMHRLLGSGAVDRELVMLRLVRILVLCGQEEAAGRVVRWVEDDLGEHL
jgi:hypothetical protein